METGRGDSVSRPFPFTTKSTKTRRSQRGFCRVAGEILAQRGVGRGEPAGRPRSNVAHHEKEES